MGRAARGSLVDDTHGGIPIAATTDLESVDAALEIGCSVGSSLVG